MMENCGSGVVGRRSKCIFELGIIPLGIATVSLPFFGFVTCVILSLLYNFESSTATHCRVSHIITHQHQV